MLGSLSAEHCLPSMLYYYSKTISKTILNLINISVIIEDIFKQELLEKNNKFFFPETNGPQQEWNHYTGYGEHK